VVEQIESGTYTVLECQRLYSIGGSMTIYNWLRRFGKAHLIANHVVIQMKDERDRLKQLEADNQELESALAQAHLKILVLESTLKAAEAHYGEDVKKTSPSKPHPQPRRRGKRQNDELHRRPDLPGASDHAARLLSAATPA
jgi:transposase-like protein